MEASEPKWVNPVMNIIGVNSLMLEGLQILKWFSDKDQFFAIIIEFFIMKTSLHQTRDDRYEIVNLWMEKPIKRVLNEVH